VVARYVMSVDQGTTSTRCLLFDQGARLVSMTQREHRQHYPKPGWVEHDALEIWANVEQVVEGALKKLGIGPPDLAAVGITNQRETTLLWEKATGRPIANALVWQDTRTDRLVRDLGGLIGQDRFRDQCGLPLATYFSGPKIRWLLD
jgi:glycerol kinase